METIDRLLLPRGFSLLFLILFIFALCCTLFIWRIFGGTPAEFVTRLGISLEIIGLFAVVPEIIGANRLEQIKNRLENILTKFKDEKQIFIDNHDLDFLSNGEGCISGIAILAVSLMSILFILGGLIFYVSEVGSQLKWKPSETYSVPITLSCSLLFFIALFAQIVYRLKRKTPPQFISSIFAFIFFSWLLTLARPLFIALMWTTEFSISHMQILLAKYSLKTFVLGITVPLTLFGNLLQLIGTYL